MYMAAPDSY